jgi:hypothetical protein
MNSRSKIFTGVALAALATTAASAQAPAHLRDARTGVVATAVAPDSAHIAATLAAANDFVRLGRVREAMRSFHSVAVEQRAAGDYPAEALRRLASLQFGLEQELEAAHTLDELASAAQEFGDPATQLQSLFDAAIIYQKLKMNDRVPERVRQINQLLKSPAIDQQLRSEIASRLVRG